MTGKETLSRIEAGSTDIDIHRIAALMKGQRMDIVKLVVPVVHPPITAEELLLIAGSWKELHGNDLVNGEEVHPSEPKLFGIVDIFDYEALGIGSDYDGPALGEITVDVVNPDGNRRIIKNFGAGRTALFGATFLQKEFLQLRVASVAQGRRDLERNK